MSPSGERLTRLPEMGKRMPDFRRLLRLCATALMGLSSALPAPAAAQTRVENVATFQFRTTAGGSSVIQSNRTVLEVQGSGGATPQRAKLPTSVSFRTLPASYTFRNQGPDSCRDGTPPRYIASDVLPSEFEGTRRLETMTIEEPMMIVLVNEGGNRDPNVRETAWIAASTNAHTTNFVLTETSVNSGIFAGAFPGSSYRRSDASTSPCRLDIHKSSIFRLNFMEDEFSFASNTSLLIDPQGYIFDSTTGEVIDGAVVSVVDAMTGLPAPVFGDDGVSAYPSTVTSGQSVTDSGGRQYNFATGLFRFPLMAPGAYRLVVTPPPGYRAPSTASAEQLASLSGPEGAFRVSEASYGRAFTLSSPEPLYVDIPVDTDRSGEVILDKIASTRTAAPGDVIQYRLRVTNRHLSHALGVTVIADSLPVGLRYRRGSTRGTAEAEVSGDGRSLTFSLSSVAAGQTAEIRYMVEVAPGALQGEAINRARAHSASGESNEASASVRIKPLLFSDAMTIIGRVTEGGCGDPLRQRKGVPGVRLLLEDGTQVVTDKDGLYHFEGVKAGTHVVQIDRHSIAATHEPVACDSDTRQAGSAISRFVESGGGSLQRVDFQLRRTSKGAADLNAPPITALADADAAGGNRDWLKAATPGIDWLFPAVDHNPRAPALRVVIKHRPGQRVALRINGEAVDPMSFDGSTEDEARGVAVSTWTGIPLGQRDNALEARVLDKDGRVAATLTRTVHVSTQAARAEMLPGQSRLTADGLVRPLVAVRLTDRDGRPVRAGTTVGFRVDQPYAAAIDADMQAQRQLAGRERAPAFARVTGDDGLAFIALEPTTQAGAAHVTVLLDEKGVTRETAFTPWLVAAAQDWTIVGFGKGTLGYDTLRTRVEAPGAERGKVVTDGELRFYAKGRIKGSWLMTIAYDSDRTYDADRGLMGAIDPDRYYTVYGDGTRQSYDAATRRKLYLRLERREFRALFGDFETGLTETSLARYSRTLNGVKADYHGRRISFTGFAAENSQLYARDEIQGNGLSGPFRLSGRDIVPNSDKVRIEVRDRFRSEKILSSRQLTRHIDYDIDTDAGTLRFRDPVLSRDSDLNPVFIVAEYETAQGRSNTMVAGGRVAARFARDRVEVGASLLRDQSMGAGAVAGLDVKAKVGRGTELRAETASGGRGGIGEGRAFQAEVIHQGRTADASAYVRQQDSGFGLGQQNAVEAGTRKIGMDGRIRLTDRISASGSGWYQTNLTDAGRRMAADARVEYRTGTGLLYAGTQIASDTGIGGISRDSRLLTLGGSQRPFGQKLELFGQTQLALGGQADSIDFPVRHKAGIAYEVKHGFRLIAEHEMATSAVKAHQTRVGVDVAPWAGGKLLGTAAQEAVGENGARTFAQYGLNQSIPLGKRWTVDVTVDATTTVSGRAASEDIVNPLHPTASGGGLDREGGNGDHQAFTLGATYRAAKWTWNGRAEYRHGSVSDRWGVTSGLLRTLGEGRTLAAGVRAYSVRERSGAVAGSFSADLALALRPLDSRWSVLERLEVRRDRADAGIRSTNVLGVSAGTGDAQLSTRIVNNIAVNYRSGDEGDGHGWEGSLYYGAKYIVGRFGDDSYTGFIDVIGFDLRKDLGRRFDLSVQAARQHSWSSKVSQFSAGPSLGYSPGQNIWISAGYNVTGFRDRDFEDARYTRQGPFVTMRMKFDQLSLGKAARSIMGRGQ
ncbi:MAG TPA: hypothetical protein VF475_15860 [Sphingobium sp.]